jgi:hypothetical protein
MKNEKPLSIRLYEKYMQRFDKCTDQEIIKAFNKEAGNCGWGTARASYLSALHKQLDNRNFDYSEIGDEGSMSLKSKIKLEGNVIKKIDDKLDINPDNGLWKVIPDKNESSGHRVERLC